MTTTLNTPIAKNETQATLDAWSLTVIRNADATVDLTQTLLGATLSVRYADGTFSRRVDLTQALGVMSPPALAVVRQFHTALIGYLRTQGVLPAGNDTADF